jgi:23S rRNA (cytosine1962-C5)-methyltransferase
MINRDVFENRLKKNHKKFHKYFNSQNIEAYRLYDKDIPEFPYQIDRYNDHAVIYDKGKRVEEADQYAILEKLQVVKEVTSQIIGVNPANIVIKSRLIQKGKDQYEKAENDPNFFTVREYDAQYRINLESYLDSGLFLDHRPLRKIISKDSESAKVLNLFSYTGSFSVVAALNKAFVTTVDMSNTYINWSKENFKLNNLNPNDHLFITQNCFDFLKTDDEKYDIIILDPPSFSNSKKMTTHFDIQRDHDGLVNMCMDRLDVEEGVLYFSNNLRSFKIDENLIETYDIKNITKSTIPSDFKDQKIHQCFKITWRKRS